MSGRFFLLGLPQNDGMCADSYRLELDSMGQVVDSLYLVVWAEVDAHQVDAPGNFGVDMLLKIVAGGSQ
jgi:hypothetical protein